MPTRQSPAAGGAASPDVSFEGVTIAGGVPTMGFIDRVDVIEVRGRQRYKVRAGSNPGVCFIRATSSQPDAVHPTGQVSFVARSPEHRALPQRGSPGPKIREFSILCRSRSRCRTRNRWRPAADVDLEPAKVWVAQGLAFEGDTQKC